MSTKTICTLPTESLPGGRPWLVRSRSWVSIAILAPFAGLAAVSIPIVTEDSLTDFVLDAAGWACFVAGAVFRWWATLYVAGRKCRELALDGPYSICRNPLYFGTFLITLAIAFFIHSTVFAIGLLVATPMYLQVTVPWEEQCLRRLFGERFDEYGGKVPKFIPAFSLFQSPATLHVNLNGLVGESRIAIRWIWVPFVADAVAHLRAQPWWPTLVNLP